MGSCCGKKKKKKEEKNEKSEMKRPPSKISLREPSIKQMKPHDPMELNDFTSLNKDHEYGAAEVSLKQKSSQMPDANLPLPPDEYQIADYSSIETEEDDTHHVSKCRFFFPVNGKYHSILENRKRIPLGWTCDSVTGKYAYVFMIHKQTAMAIMKLFSEHPKLNRLEGNCFGKLYRSTNYIEDVVFVVIKSIQNNPIQIDFALKYLIQFGVKFFRDERHVIFHKDPMRKLGRDEFDKLALKCRLDFLPNKYIRARYFGFEDTV